MEKGFMTVVRAGFLNPMLQYTKFGKVCVSGGSEPHIPTYKIDQDIFYLAIKTIKPLLGPLFYSH